MTEPEGEPSVLVLALRVLRGELTEAQAIEVVKGRPHAKDVPTPDHGTQRDTET